MHFLQQINSDVPFYVVHSVVGYCVLRVLHFTIFIIIIYACPLISFQTNVLADISVAIYDSIVACCPMQERPEPVMEIFNGDIKL